MYRIRSNVTGWFRNVIEPGAPRRVSAAMTIIVASGAFLWIDRDTLLVAQSQVETAQREIRAQRFLVVDNAGNERGVFGVLPSGQTGLRIWDAGKTIAATLEIDQGGMPRLAFERTDGTPLAELGILDKQSPVFILRDASGNRRLAMVVTKDGTVSIGLYDTNKRKRCGIFLDRDGQPQITLRDNRGTGRARLMLDNDGTCALDLFDRKGQARVVFQVDAQDHADAAVFGRDGKATWSAGKP